MKKDATRGERVNKHIMILNRHLVVYTVNGLKIRTLLFLFSNKMLVFRAEKLVTKANREDPVQTASSEAA